MGEFKINLSRTKVAVSDLEQMESLFGQYVESLNDCASRVNLAMHYHGINAALRTVSKNIVIEKTQLAALKSALEQVAQLYSTTDNNILGTGKDSVAPPSGSGTVPGTGPSAGNGSGTGSEEEKKGAIENTLEILEEIVGHDAMSFITLFVEALSKIEGLGTGVDIAAGILSTLNYLIDDLQDGATINSLYANMIVCATATLLSMGAGIAVEAAITGAITAACAGATGGVGAAIAPFANVIGKVVGAGASILTGHAVDSFNEADWDHDGESNREEVKGAVEAILDWRYPYGDDHTFYLPEGV